jgi:hypothetical protein
VKFSNLVVALILLILTSSLASGIVAKTAHPKVLLRPSFDEAGISIERVITVVNENPYEVMVRAIEGNDPHALFALHKDTLYLAPNETGDFPFTINLEYGGKYQFKLISAFSPVEAIAGSQSLGVVSVINIIAEGPEAPEGYFDEMQEIVEELEEYELAEQEGEDYEEPIETQPEEFQEETETLELKQTGGSVWIGIVTVLIVLIIGGIAFLTVWKLGLLK